MAATRKAAKNCLELLKKATAAGEKPVIKSSSIWRGPRVRSRKGRGPRTQDPVALDPPPGSPLPVAQPPGTPPPFALHHSSPTTESPVSWSNSPSPAPPPGSPPPFAPTHSSPTTELRISWSMSPSPAPPPGSPAPGKDEEETLPQKGWAKECLEEACAAAGAASSGSSMVGFKRKPGSELKKAGMKWRKYLAKQRQGLREGDKVALAARERKRARAKRRKCQAKRYH